MTRTGTIARRTAVAILALAAALGRPWADDPVQARAFEVHHRPLGDAAEVVGTILSDEGRVTLRPRLRTIVVEDRLSVLERIPSLLESYDLPPRTVEVTISLALGSDRRRDQAGRSAPGQGLSREIRGVTESLGDFTKWTAYEPIGTRAVSGTEGAPVSVRLSDEYRVTFQVESVRQDRGEVTFRSFSLQRVERSEDGSERFRELQTFGLTLPIGGVHVVGAAKGPESSQALFLFLQTKEK